MTRRGDVPPGRTDTFRHDGPPGPLTRILAPSQPRRSHAPTVLLLVVLVATPASASSAASRATPPARDGAAPSAVDSIAKRPRRTFRLQPGWAPRLPTIHAGPDLVRYERIEGLSVGLSATAPFGSGYTAQAVGRFGFADRVPNGELALARSNGRTEITGALLHRLAVANDD